MTRKDYKLIASELNDTLMKYGYSGVPTFGDAVDALIIALKSDNPRFNEDKFREAVYGD